VRRLALIALLAVVLVPAAASAAPGSSSTGVQLTPVLRVPFPDRGYIVDLPKAVHLSSSDVQLSENGIGIGDVTVSPVSASGLRTGVVLAIDSSLTMKGTPYANAIAAARAFLARRATNELVGVLTFNRAIRVLQPVTTSASTLEGALAHPPRVAYGTRIFDAVDTSLALLRRAKVSTGAIVLLTDGQNVGSHATLSGAVTRAYRQHVRVFTVGLLSPAYHAGTLNAVAAGTGGSYVEATSPKALAPIYASISSRLASEYLIEYRSLAPPNTHVDVQVAITGLGSSATSYTSPKPSGLKPFHHSAVDRFLLSGWSLFLLALAVAGLAVLVVRKFVPGTASQVVQRVAAFAGGGDAAEAEHPAYEQPKPRPRPSTITRRTQGLLGRLDRDLEIAEIKTSALAMVGGTAIATVCAMIILAVISPVFVILGFAVPLVPRAFVRYRLRKVRDKFAEQLPPNLQVMASALRAGHSFIAALASVVEQAEEPSKKELRRAVSDEQLGVPIDEALRRVAERMQSRDLDQVALVAELQRTTGGNVAEVLDVVVATIRDRQDVRRMVKTLTAQGRMARWVLTCLPIFTGFAFYLIQPRIVGPFYGATIGQIVLVMASIAVICGSLAIQRIVEIEV
jgi:tight adherence protein B